MSILFGEEMSLFKKIGLFILDFTETGVIAFSMFIIVYLFIIQPHEVDGSSMFDSFENGDFLLTDKISYNFNDPERGDVIVFKAPVSGKDYIKRIIGMPEETVSIKDGQVYINGERLEEKYLMEDIKTRGGKYLRDNDQAVVPPGQYFVMGDNRINSSDSRDWGTVPREDIIGIVRVRYWPIAKLGRIKKEEYNLQPAF